MKRASGVASTSARDAVGLDACLQVCRLQPLDYTPLRLAADLRYNCACLHVLHTCVLLLPHSPALLLTVLSSLHRTLGDKQLTAPATFASCNTQHACNWHPMDSSSSPVWVAIEGLIHHTQPIASETWQHPLSAHIGRIGFMCLWVHAVPSYSPYN